jgi:hypothetical protein
MMGAELSKNRYQRRRNARNAVPRVVRVKNATDARAGPGR